MGGGFQHVDGQYVGSAARRGADAADQRGQRDAEHDGLAKRTFAHRAFILLKQKQGHRKHHGDHGNIRKDGRNQSGDHHQQKKQTLGFSA